MNKVKKIKKTNISKLSIKNSLKLKKPIKKHISKKLFSNQTKQALFYAIQEAKKNNFNVITSKYMFFGILKANPSLLSNIFNNVSEKNKLFKDDTNYFIYKCKLLLKQEKGQIITLEQSKKITLSKSVRDLFKSLLSQSITKLPLISENLIVTKPLDGLQKNQFKTITTFFIFKELIKNESIKIWFKDEIFLQKK